jgi:signal transduction histidine kinase
VKFRWRVFYSHIVAIAVVVLVVAISVRSIAVGAISAHMGGMMSLVSRSTEIAVTEGVTEALLWAAAAGVAVAIVASFAVSGWLTSTLGQMAGVAGRIAAGEFDQRVSYSADDEVGELARSFNDMAGRLEQTENVRRELLGTISHELRTPLTNIQGYMEGLIDGVVPEEPGTYQLVHREAARLSRLVADIERLSRVEAGAERIEPRRLPTGRVVGDTVERLRPQFEQKPLSLSLEIVEAVPDVWADEDKLVQILTNVVGNSFAYTPAGGHVTVRVRSTSAAAGAGDERGLSGGRTMVLFEVSDDGMGIPADDLPHVFERFYRVDKSRSALGGGAGIGLAVARSLVDQMGGSISAESVLGQGTLVWFGLPAATGVRSAEDAIGEVGQIVRRRDRL